MIWLLPRPPPQSISRKTEKERQLAGGSGGEGVGAKSYDDERSVVLYIPFNNSYQTAQSYSETEGKRYTLHIYFRLI
jgi:hypothetical protein